MEVTVVSGERFTVTPDGHLWAEKSSPYHHEFWQRYLDVYDAVRVLARGTSVDEPAPDAVQVTGGPIAGSCVPDFHTPIDLMRDASAIVGQTRQALADAQALHLQIPNVYCNLVYLLMDRDRPFAVEVKADSYDSLSAGAFEHPLRPLYQWTFMGMQKLQCATATAATYVTEHSLQERYPPTNASFDTHFSNVILHDDAFADGPKRYERALQPARLVFVGLFEQLYKAPDVLVEAVGRCHQRGRPVELTLVGDGAYRGELAGRAEQLGIGDSVRFTGRVPRDRVLEILDEADLFVLASRQEGLPRAMIEAMARGLPCIGSHVGGIPELLPERERVEAGDAGELADRICAMTADASWLDQSAQRNYERAQQYRYAELARRRNAFCDHMRQATAAWQRAQARMVA